MTKVNRILIGMLLMGAFFSGAIPEARGNSFVYSDGVFTMIKLPYGNAQAVSAEGINDREEIAGFLSIDRFHPCGFFYYGIFCGFLDLGGTFHTFNFPGAWDTQAFGINGRGQIVGDYGGPSGGGGFLDSGGVFTSINAPGAYYTEANGINDRAEVVGFYFSSAGEYGFLDSGGTLTTITPPGAAWSRAYGINDSGQIVGDFAYSAYGPYQGFLDDGGVFTPISVPGATVTWANGINDSGQIVGFYAGGDCPLNEVCGFLDSAGVFTTLNFPGAPWTIANGINDSGQIVGIYGTTPEPGTLALLGAGMIGLAGTLRRRNGRHS